ncbi:hypothetical protein CYMTET_24109, partial [Cymbomonas tetramitiformis]
AHGGGLDCTEARAAAAAAAGFWLGTPRYRNLRGISGFGLSPLEVSEVGGCPEQHGRANYQMLALDSWSHVSVWSVTEMASADVAGADVDYGLRIGGRVKILRTTVITEFGPTRGPQPLNHGIEAEAGDPWMTEGMQPIGRRATYDMAMMPGNTNEFIVGGDQGTCLRGTRFGVSAPPRLYTLVDPMLGVVRGAARSYVESCSSISFSPIFPKYFVAAYFPATICLYTVDVGLSLMTWTDFTSNHITTVRWSPAKPNVFFALDSAASVHMFDLLSPNPSKPVHTESFNSKGGITHFEMSNTAQLISKGGSSKKEQHCFVLASEDGRVDIHMLSSDQASSFASEDEFYRSPEYTQTQAFLQKFSLKAVATGATKE